MLILMDFSPTSKVSDIEALLDSYAVVLSRDTKALQSGPLWQIEMRGGIGTQRPRGVTDLHPPFDPTLDLCLIRYQPPSIYPPDEEHRAIKSRWPFFVESELTVVLSAGGQWWRFDFLPGRTYTDRTPAALPQSETLAPQHDGGLPKEKGNYILDYPEGRK